MGAAGMSGFTARSRRKRFWARLTPVGRGFVDLHGDASRPDQQLASKTAGASRAACSPFASGEFAGGDSAARSTYAFSGQR